MRRTSALASPYACVERDSGVAREVAWSRHQAWGKPAEDGGSNVTMADSGNRLFVGNMPFRMTRDELFDLFAQAGTVVSVHIPTDRETGRPRGFGFVEMEDPVSMEQAVQMFNGYSVSGRALVVNQARPREARPQF